MNFGHERMRVLCLPTDGGTAGDLVACFARQKGQQINRGIVSLWKPFRWPLGSCGNDSALFGEAALCKSGQKVTLGAVWPLSSSASGSKGRGELHRSKVPPVCLWASNQNISKQLTTQGYEGVRGLVLGALDLFEV